eukprot:6523954-Alexandrium_andersonii.AAC.1
MLRWPPPTSLSSSGSAAGVASSCAASRGTAPARRQATSRSGGCQGTRRRTGQPTWPGLCSLPKSTAWRAVEEATRPSALGVEAVEDAEVGEGLWKIKDTPRWSAADLTNWPLKL